MALKISFPSISSKLPSDVQQFLQRVREAFSKGGVVTEEDLVSAGIASRTPTGTLTPGVVDYSIPPAPTGLTATGTITAIFLQWDNPEEIGWRNFSYAEIWRSAENNLGTAVLNGTSDFYTYVDTVEPASTYYYWVRFVSRADVSGPFQGTVGVEGKTNDDPERILDLLTDSITASQLHQTLGARIDLVDGSGTGSVNARIAAEASALAQDILDEASAREGGDGTLFAQYAVRLDVGGKVIGFGLMADGPEGEADSFEIRADRFIVAAPAGYEESGVIPFVVDTIAGIVAINGAVIKTASIKTASIEDAAITNAKIVDLSAGKITSGEINGQEITLGLGGLIKSGQTAYNTGAGFWLGMGIDGFARFSVGSPDAHGLNYDESTGIMNFRGLIDLKAGSLIDGSIPVGTLSSLLKREWEWNFPAGSLSLLGWTGGGCTVTAQATGLKSTATSTDPRIISPSIQVDGSRYTKVKARVRRLTSGGNFEGWLYWRTNGHSYSGLYKAVETGATASPLSVIDQWYDLEWDIHYAVAGKDDWLTNTILSIRIDLTSGGGTEEIEVERIYLEGGDTQIDGVNIHADSSIIIGNTTESVGSRYAAITDGDIIFYDYYSGAFHEFKSLKKTVYGDAANGDTVNLGYFRETPKVILSQNNLMSYNSAYAQSQTFVLNPLNLRKVGDDWLFDVQAQLHLLDNYVEYLPPGMSFSSNFNSAQADIYTDWYYSPGYTIPVARTRAVTLDCWVQTQAVTDASWWDDYNQAYVNVAWYHECVIEYIIGIRHSGGWAYYGYHEIVGSRYEQPCTRNFTVNASCAYDILEVKLVVRVRFSWTNIYQADGVGIGIGNAYRNISAGFTKVSCSLAGGVISVATGRANYLAVG